MPDTVALGVNNSSGSLLFRMALSPAAATGRRAVGVMWNHTKIITEF
jgi:hypothetical protein